MADNENLPHHCVYRGAIFDDDGYCPNPVLVEGKEMQVKPAYVMYPGGMEGSRNGQ